MAVRVYESVSDARSKTAWLLQQVEYYRVNATERLTSKHRSKLGQFMTPTQIACFMASLFDGPFEEVNLLDPGAGVGGLTAAFVAHIIDRQCQARRITVDAYEIEPSFAEHLNVSLNDCRHACAQEGIAFSSRVIQEDFIECSSREIRDFGGLFAMQAGSQYTHCIMNPPYKKLSSDSEHRMWLRRIGIEATNLYSAFMSAAIKLLVQGGELVAIVPRSFCNGAYFRPFRRLLLSEMSLRRLHVFDSRSQTFKDDDVLQENIILHAVKGARQSDVIITSSAGPDLRDMTFRQVAFEQIVKPQDSDQFIHIAVSDFDQLVVDRISHFTHSLDDLGLTVSTGPVVDFRVAEDIREQPEQGTVPLIYPSHFSGSVIEWPKPQIKKPNAIAESSASRRWLMPNAWYVLTRRFTAKEEPRRLVAALHDPERVPARNIGFENHLNVFHRKKSGLDPSVARGLTVYLNSTLLDLYFRQFSGSTQVNATDLRVLHYPSLEILSRLGKSVEDGWPDQAGTDALLEAEILRMSEQPMGESPLEIKRKTDEALQILKALDLPRGQLNERSALTLLALLRVKPGDPWSEASDPLVGITPAMDFIRDHYGKEYAPNTRETIRRYTMHQFEHAELVAMNPDCPERPTNSPKFVYQIAADALALVRTFGTAGWTRNAATYLRRHKPLVETYAKRRKMRRVPLTIHEDADTHCRPGSIVSSSRPLLRILGHGTCQGAWCFTSETQAPSWCTWTAGSSLHLA